MIRCPFCGGVHAASYKCNARVKIEARKAAGVEEQRTQEGHGRVGSEESLEGVERVDGSVDPPQRGSEGKSQGERTKEWKKRNPDKWRAYMRVYMRKKRHKVK
jgi:hypothetical protein